MTSLFFPSEKQQRWPLTHRTVRNNQDWCGKDDTVLCSAHGNEFWCLSPPSPLSGPQFHGHQDEKVKLDRGQKTRVGLCHLLPLA